MEKEQAVAANIAIGRHLHGFWLNPLEFVLDDKDEVMLFETEACAKEFLNEHGWDDLRAIKFVDMSEQADG